MSFPEQISRLIIIRGSQDFDLSQGGHHNLIYSIEGCNEFLDISINEINAGPNQVACPTQLPFNLVGSPNNGTWNGNNITNTNAGTFDPSLSSGLNIVTYAMNGCIDTTEIWVVAYAPGVDYLSPRSGCMQRTHPRR